MKGDTIMLIFPGLAGWMAVGTGVMLNALGFISLFIPVFGE